MGFRSSCGLVPWICGFAALLSAGAEACGTVQTWIPNEVPEKPCLCVFDVDRTLTGFQDLLSECPDNKVEAGVKDYAYLYNTPAGYGNLTLSKLSQVLNSTFCSRCYLGIASAGGASLDGEKRVLLDTLRSVSTEAASKLPVEWLTSDSLILAEGPPPLVVWCAEEHKHDCTRRIVGWYRGQNVLIADADVWFFDDKEGNTAPFQETAFNAQQVSCRSRNGTRGLCGATPEEVQFRTGVFVCRDGQQVCMDSIRQGHDTDPGAGVPGNGPAQPLSEAAQVRNYLALSIAVLASLTAFN